MGRISKRTQPPTYYREDSSKLRTVKRKKVEDTKSEHNESSNGFITAPAQVVPPIFRSNSNQVTIDTFKILSVEDLTPDDTDLEVIERKVQRIQKPLPHHKPLPDHISVSSDEEGSISKDAD